MKTHKILSAFLAIVMVCTSIIIPAYAAETTDTATLAEDFGTATNNADGSITLNFGQDSITTSGGGEIITDDVNDNVLRPNNLRTNDNDLAVLTLSSVTLTGSNYDKVEIYAGNKNTANVTVKVGETEVASISNINTGSDNNAWFNYQLFTANLSYTEAEGAVTLNISGVGGKTYCGNYVYVRFYNSGAPAVSPDPSASEEP